MFSEYKTFINTFSIRNSFRAKIMDKFNFVSRLADFILIQFVAQWILVGPRTGPTTQKREKEGLENSLRTTSIESMHVGYTVVINH